MPTQQTLLATAPALRLRLRSLEAEQAQAALLGLDANELYMTDLRRDLVGARSAYVGAAVTEIAILRAQLDEPLQG